jgi:putative transposase
MTNHVHLLMTPEDASGISRVMQSVGRRYVQHINRANQRTGTLWEGRHKASLVDADAYLVSCLRYIELNPVRAGMVRRAGDYPWSSCRCLAYGAHDALVDPHAVYLSLGGDDEARRRAYRSLFDSELEAETVQAIRAAAAFSMPLGGEGFKNRVEQALGRPTGQARRGRPQATRVGE